MKFVVKSNFIFYFLIFQVLTYMNKITFQPNPHWKFDTNKNGPLMVTDSNLRHPAKFAIKFLALKR